MHVLECRIPGEPPGRDVRPQALEARDEGIDLRWVEHLGPPEAANVGDRTLDVVESQRLIDPDRAREVRHALVARFREPAAPELHPASVRSAHGTDAQWPAVVQALLSVRSDGRQRQDQAVAAPGPCTRPRTRCNVR